MGVEIQKLKQLRKKRYSMHNEKFEIERNSDDVISLFKQDHKSDRYDNI